MRPLRLTVVCALALAAGRAEAQNADAEAEARFKAGKQAYRLGDYDEAIAAWKEAYRLKDNPAFLFNIAQAYREKGDLPKAVLFFENYLKESPNAANRADVEARVAELKKLIEDQKAAAQRPPNGPVDPIGTQPARPPEPVVDPVVEPTATRPTPLPEPAAPPPRTGAGRGMRIAGIATAGTGLALTATGIVFGMKARTAQDDVETAVKSGAVWTDELDDKDASGRRAATISNVTIGVGAAAVSGGGVLYFLGRKAGQAERADVALVPTHDGLAVSFAGRF